MIYSAYLTHEIEVPDILFEASSNVFERVKAIFQKFIDFIDKLCKNIRYNILLKGSHYRKYKSFIDHGFNQIYITKNKNCVIDFLDFERVKKLP